MIRKGEVTLIKIGVVILNYIVYQTTIETVTSFDKQDKNGFEVVYVIVDNDSPNESFEKLQEEYKGRDDVIITCTKKNLGFANGNNHGCRKLFERMQPDFVIVSNDDILLPQQGLYQWIVDCYKKYHFAVLGPDIYSLNGKFHQSPGENFSQDKKVCKKALWNIQKDYYISIIKKALRRTNYTGYTTWENDLYEDVHENKTLHGSFQIFSASFFKEYSEPYDPGTFLYMEENILKLRCDKAGLPMVYEPSYQIHHLQAVSTNAANINQSDKQIARYKHLMHSMRVYIQHL